MLTILLTNRNGVPVKLTDKEVDLFRENGKKWP